MTTAEVKLSNPPQDSDFPEGFDQNLKDAIKNCARIESIIKHIKSFSKSFDESYTLDLNPHLSIIAIAKEVVKLVNFEGHSPKTSYEEVLVFWLTELHHVKDFQRMAEEAPRYKT